MRNRLVLILTVLVVAAFVHASMADTLSGSQPNIIFVMTDD